MKRRTIMDIDADARDAWHERAIRDEALYAMRQNSHRNSLFVLSDEAVRSLRSIVTTVRRGDWCWVHCGSVRYPWDGLNELEASGLIEKRVRTGKVFCKATTKAWKYIESIAVKERRNSVDTHCSECGGQYYSYVCRDCSQPFEYGCYHNRQEFRGRCYNCHEEWKYRDQAMSSAAAELGWTNSPYDADW